MTFKKPFILVAVLGTVFASAFTGFFIFRESGNAARVKQVIDFEQGTLDGVTMLMLIVESEQSRMLNVVKQLQEAAEGKNLSEAEVISIYWNGSGKEMVRNQSTELKDSFEKAVERLGKVTVVPDGCELISQARGSLVSSTEAFISGYSQEPPDSFHTFANTFASSGKQVVKDFDTLLSEIKRDVLPSHQWGKSGTFEKVVETDYSDLGLSEQYHFMASGVVIKESVMKIVMTVRTFHVTTYHFDKNNLVIAGKNRGQEVFRDDGDSLVLIAETDSTRDVSKSFEQKRFKKVR